MADRDNLVKAIIKALTILELLNNENELSIAELSLKLKMQKSTVHRLLSTLRFKGYVVQNPVTLKYKNSLKLFEMGNNMIEGLGLRREAQFFLEELNHKTNETINLAILDKYDIVYIDKIDSPEPVRIGLSIGKRVPAYCTALGKVLLAHMGEENIDTFLRHSCLERFTENTIYDKQILRAELQKIKEQGYSIDDEEYFYGLRAVASPILNYNGEVIASLSIAFPTVRYISENDKLQEFIQEVKQTAKNISIRLGYNND